MTFTATYGDVGSADTHTAVWTIDGVAQPSSTVTGGVATLVKTFTAAGVYSVSLKITDDDGGAASANTIGGLDYFIVVYDPSAGFVTGGGWINSPAGAYRADQTLVGKANFGFVSKYQKGASIPTGETQFQFHAGSLNFHSQSYEWLVIAGARAQYKGVGTVNGVAGYGFILTAIDGPLPGGGGIDKFRIRIYARNIDGSEGGLVYDNQDTGGLNDALDPARTALGGGNIVIHAK